MYRAIQRTCLLLASVLMLTCGPSLAPADSIDVSLNLLYSDPGDTFSGGQWEIAAKSDGYGIYGLQLLLTGINSVNLAGPAGTVNGSNPAGFTQLDTFNHGTYFEVTVGQLPVIPLESGDEQSLFYGVGTLVNGAPDYSGAPLGTSSIGPTFTSLTPAGISWAPGDSLGDPTWDTAAVLLTGTFAAGTAPNLGFYQDAENSSSGIIFSSLGTSTTIGSRPIVDPIMTFVRDNLLAELPGDYNDDGIVDVLDYIVWRNNFDSPTPVTLPNDTTPESNSEDDFLVWKANFGATGGGAGSGAALAAATVPEPASWALLGIGAGTLFFGRLRRGCQRAGFVRKNGQ